MRTVTHERITLGLSFLLLTLAPAAEITWGTPSTITAPTDISNPLGNNLIVAADFNNPTGTAVGDDNIINGIPFEQMPNAGNGTSLVTNMSSGPAYGTNFFTGGTGDGDLDALLDSHSYTLANPAEITVTVNGLNPGFDYQIQLIAVADARSCCSGRTYEPDDGQGNYNTGIEMNRGGFLQVLGSFTADATSQTFLWRSLGGVGGSNSDPGFSGLVVLEIPPTDDSDGDGLTDLFENLNGLNPNSDDSDGDMILDGDEDEDNDFSTNLEEQSSGTNPNDEDSDDDNLLDGYETNTGVWISATDTGTDPNNDDSDDDNLLDGVENPDLPFVDANQTGSDPNTDNSDSDGLPDDVEVALALDPGDEDSDNDGTNDNLEDSDSDGSMNGDELTLGTNPGDEDTDNDGFLDGVETNTGVWVSASNTGTDPLNDDSDNDGLLDGVENPDLPFVDADQTGSDPNTLDSDGDFRDDGFEITEGSDPNDPNSNTPLPEITVLSGLVGGDLTDPENDGVDIAGAVGLNFNWVSISSSSESYFSDASSAGTAQNEGAFDVFDNKVGGGEAKWCCSGAPQDLTVEFAEPVSITNFTMTSGNDTPTRDPINWEIQGSNDGITFTPIYTSTTAGLWTARNQTLLFSLETPAPPYTFIRYSVTLTGDANHQLNEIEYFGTVGGSSSAPVITDVDYDPVGDTITLTWNSAPDKTYTVLSSPDLVLFDTEIIDGLASGGETTSFQFANPIPGLNKQFFRVMEE